MYLNVQLSQNLIITFWIWTFKSNYGYKYSYKVTIYCWYDVSIGVHHLILQTVLQLCVIYLAKLMVFSCTNMWRLQLSQYKLVPSTCNFYITVPILRFFDTIQDLYLYQHVTLSTRYRLNEIPTTLDLMFTKKDMISDLKHTPGLGFIDHECLWCCISYV